MFVALHTCSVATGYVPERVPGCNALFSQTWMVTFVLPVMPHSPGPPNAGVTSTLLDYTGGLSSSSGHSTSVWSVFASTL